MSIDYASELERGDFEAALSQSFVPKFALRKALVHFTGDDIDKFYCSISLRHTVHFIEQQYYGAFPSKAAFKRTVDPMSMYFFDKNYLSVRLPGNDYTCIFSKKLRLTHANAWPNQIDLDQS